MSPAPTIQLACPDEGELFAFADGRLPETASGVISEHLTRCRPCEEIHRRVTAESSLAQMLRLTGSASVVLEPECVRMQAAVREIPRRAGRLPDDLSQSSTNTSRLSTEAPQVKSVRGNDLTTISHEAAPAKIGRYRIQSILGEGAYGRVYLATDPDLDRQVALKVPKFASRLGGKAGGPLVEALMREARTAAKLKHPGIVTIYDVGYDDQAGCYVAMEYVEGQSLKQVLAAGKVPHELAASYVAQAAEALAYAHKLDLVHRDLKPANLLVDGNGSVKVADFGLAIFEEEQRKHPGEFAGTLAYCSPEQIRGEVPHLDGRTDIWSLGVILYELLTGRRPFGGPSITDEILHRPPKPPRQIDSKVPPELERVFLRCCQQAVAQRYATALDVAEDLKQWLSRARPPNPFRRLALAAGGAAIVLLPLSLWLASRPRARSAASLLRNPTRIAWDPYDIHDKYGYEEEDQCFRFDAFGDAIFSVANVKQAPVDLEINFSLRRSEGFGGVCWGLTSLPDGGFHCYAVRAGRARADLPFEVGICQFEIGSIPVAKQGVRSGNIHHRLDPAMPDSSRMSLRIRAEDNVVHDIWLNHSVLLDQAFDIPKKVKAMPGTAGVGFYGQFAEMSVFDFNIR